MNLMLVPGYAELFGKPNMTYEQLVGEIPSEVIITSLITLNNELDVPLPSTENQHRLRRIFTSEFTDDQVATLNVAFNNYIARVGNDYKGTVFTKPTLMSMILRELNNYRDFRIRTITSQQRYNILLAYFLVVDEVNNFHANLVSDAANDKDNPLFKYKLLWTSNITQFEFNDSIEVGFELYKLLCFCKYCLDNLRPYLKEYLVSRGLKSVSELLGSTSQVIHATFQYNETARFRRLTYIQPIKGVDESYLRLQTINSQIGKSISLPTIKIRPLFYNQSEGYMITDINFLRKKTYRGPFFELHRGTSLSKKLSGDTYISNISLNVLEKLCFRSILSNLQSHKQDFIHFDEGVTTMPDCYYRHNRDIFLLEFKAYVFPVGLTEKPSFEKIKNYIDERFVVNQNEHSKGISQLANQIKIIAKGGFDFDEKYKSDLYEKSITIYPVILHSEYYFRMPGINEYLNEKLQEKINDLTNTKIIIKPLIISDLYVFFDLVQREKNILDFKTFCDRYYSILKNRKDKLKKEFNSDNYLRAFAGFDEIHFTILEKELGKLSRNNAVNDLIRFIGLTQREIDEVL